MAKVKSSGLRNYVGRLGGSVYYMLKGQNIAREKAPEVSNPRTATQMRQRMQWANLVAMYKCLQPYLGKKSFQNKLATWSDYNAFMSANLGATPVYMTKEMVQNGHAILAPYKVSEGSLPAVGLAYDEGSIGFKSDIDVSSLILGEDNSVGALSTAILDNNTTWQEGDQLGIIVMMNGRAYRPYVYAFELILDKSDTRPITDVFGIDDYPFIKSDDKLVLTYENLFNPTQGLAISAAFIHSRTIAGKTSVSTQSLVLNAAATSEYLEQTTEDAFNAARESYGLPTEVWLDAGYQGTRGGAHLGNRIMSFTGRSQPDDTGATVPFTITDGGPNTFYSSDTTAQDTKTYCTLRMLKPLDVSETNQFCLAFLPSGNPDKAVVSPVKETTSVRVITFEFPRTSATEIQNKPGVFCVVNSDVYQVDRVVAEVEVVAP